MIVSVEIDDRDYHFNPLAMTGPTQVTSGERTLIAAALRVAADIMEGRTE